MSFIHSNRSVGNHPAIYKEILKEKGHSNTTTATQATKDDTKIKANERFVAICFLKYACKARFGKLAEDNENAFTQGSSLYPKMLSSAYSLLIKYKNSYSSNGTSSITSANNGC